MRIEVRKLVIDNEKLQEEIKKKLAKQLINININVKKNIMLEGKYDENIDLDLLYKMYQQVINNLTGKELIKILKPMKHKWARKITNQIDTFDYIMNKLKNTDFNDEYENTYRDYIIKKYNEDKSLFIPKKYLESEDKLEALSVPQYGYKSSNISIEYGFKTFNYKNYKDENGKEISEHDSAEVLIFHARDEIFGGTEEKIIIPYIHTITRNSIYDEKEPINIGFTKEELKIEKDPIEEIDNYIKLWEDFIFYYSDEIKRNRNYISKEELKRLRNKIIDCNNLIQKLETKKQLILDKKLNSEEIKKLYK